jgi:OOP family OmpA-OmpF porin
MTSKGLFCALVLATMPVHAEDVGHWYFTPHVGGLWSDNDRDIEDEDWLFGVSVGKHLNDRWSLELNVNTAELDAPGGIDVGFHAASLDVLRVFGRDSAVSPYVTVGVGVLRSDLDPGSHDDHFMAQAGVGLLARLWRNDSGTRTLGLRPELKARWDDAGRFHFTDYLATLGLQFSFGPQRVEAQPTPAQSPAPEPVPAPVPPPVQPADGDSDGVADSRDRCPDTPRGVAVDADGCEQKGSITLEGVSFELNSADLTAESRPVLERTAADLKKYPRLRVEVQGHTDSSGSDQYNLTLSQRRAQAVREFLITQGVASEQLEARGYGEAQPIASNATAEGRARNRRVVVKVLENPGELDVRTSEQP